jgi:hypothetical protein
MDWTVHLDSSNIFLSFKFSFNLVTIYRHEFADLNLDRLIKKMNGSKTAQSGPIHVIVNCDAICNNITALRGVHPIFCYNIFTHIYSYEL